VNAILVHLRRGRMRAKRWRAAKLRSQFVFAALPGATAREHRKLLGQGGGSTSAGRVAPRPHRPRSASRIPRREESEGERDRRGQAKCLQTVRVGRAFVAREVLGTVRAQRRLPLRKAIPQWSAMLRKPNPPFAVGRRASSRRPSSSEKLIASNAEIVAESIPAKTVRARTPTPLAHRSFLCGNPSCGEEAPSRRQGPARR
jgi:hypothetical protein